MSEATASLFDAIAVFESAMGGLDAALMRHALRRGSTVAESERIGLLRLRLRNETTDLRDFLLDEVTG